MAKSSAQLDREITASMIAGDAELGGDFVTGKKIRKASKVAGGALLGHTASGKPVNASARPGVPNTNDVAVFHRVKAKYPGWTRADHMDAANIFGEAAQRAIEADGYGNDKLARTMNGWAALHWDIGGRWLSSEAEARASYVRPRFTL